MGDILNLDYGNIKEEEKILRKKFKSITEGLDWNTFPMRLLELSQKFRWSAYEIDFFKDREDWNKNMKPSDRMQTKLISSLFIAGEECVARDIIPLI
ncbi:MAG: hypothetical protein ACO2OV_01655 [Thermoproteota archaeon]|jgi:ribonucleoside-diphosphate reductase beta chain